MLLLSIPSILLLIYQSSLVKLKPHIGGVWCLCWFMSFQMIHWKRHLTQNDRYTPFSFHLFFYIQYNNIIMAHLFFFSCKLVHLCWSTTLNRPLFMLSCPLASVFSWAVVTLIPFLTFGSFLPHFKRFQGIIGVTYVEIW